MPAFALLSPKVWFEIALAAIVAGACWWGVNSLIHIGEERVQVKWDAEKRELAEASAKVMSDALATTKALQEGADNERKAKNAQIASLNVKLDAAINGLSNRPSRSDPSSVPKGAGEGTLCTGAGLYREDGQFLAREAARAQSLAIKLASCEADYTRLANTLK